jgi:predicted RND superfamily exporter protein
MASQSGGEIYKAFLNQDLSQLTISFRLFDAKNGQLLAEGGLRRALDRIKSYADESFGSSLDPQIWGGSLRFLDLSKVIRTDQGRSTVISIALIFLLTAFSFRSIRQGLYTLVPLVTAIMTNYVLMVAAGIPLDITTVMFSSVAIGVGVDNSIHFLLQYRKQLSLGIPPATAIQRTLEIAGRPIVLTTASVVGGLLVLLFASFRPIIYFGLLVATALTTAMVATLVVLPVVLEFDWRLRERRARAARDGARLSG